MDISKTRLKAIDKLDAAVDCMKQLPKNNVDIDGGKYDKWCTWNFIRYAHFAVSARGWTQRERHLISKFVQPGPGGAPIPNWADEGMPEFDDKRLFADYAAAVSILSRFVEVEMEHLQQMEMERLEDMDLPNANAAETTAMFS